MEERARRCAEIVLVADASRCIETRARDEYRRCVEACLRRNRPGRDLEIRLETLRRFLEQADFPRLRRESDPLIAAGGVARFQIGLVGEQARWRIDPEAGEETGG